MQQLELISRPLPVRLAVQPQKQYLEFLSFSPSPKSRPSQSANITMKCHQINSTGDSARPFQVGIDTFTDLSTAATHARNDQHNYCVGIAHGVNNNGLTLGECNVQQTQCQAASAAEISGL